MAKSAIIAETDPPTAEMMADILRHKGFRAETYGRGDDVLEAAVREQPDLIVLDCYLPDVLGSTVCHYLKSSPHTKSIPVIMTTFKAYPIERKIIAVAGAEGFLKKPLDPAQFEAEIDRLTA